MEDFVNAIMARVSARINQMATHRIGVVASVDPARHTARVTIQPDGVLSGWLPVQAIPGAVTLPGTGDQVLLAPQEGDAEHMHVLSNVYSDANPPPKAPTGFSGGTDQGGNTATHTVPGSEWMVVKGATTIRVCADGTVYIKTSRLNVDADLHVNGDVFDKHGSLDRLRVNYDAHRHAGGAFTDHIDPE